jgi:hypothetical protein
VLNGRRVVDRFDVEGEPQDPGLVVVGGAKAGGGTRGRALGLAAPADDDPPAVRRDPRPRSGHEAWKRSRTLHKLRVAVRRLRAFLRVSRSILDREWTDELRPSSSG